MKISEDFVKTMTLWHLRKALEWVEKLPTFEAIGLYSDIANALENVNKDKQAATL